MKRIGFTLVELLAVLAVLAALLAILLPVFGQVRGRARQKVCLSNERQLGMALLLYVQDSDGGMAPNGINSRPPAFWPQLISPYVHSDTCFVCPDSSAANDTLAGGWNGGRPGPPRVSYVYNLNVGGFLWFGATSPLVAQMHAARAPKMLSQIARPAATVLLTDGATDPINDSPQTWPEAGSEKDGRWGRKDFIDLGDAARVQGGPPIIGAAPSARHSGQSNVLFADGHIEARRLDSFYVLLGEQGTGEKETGISPCLDPSLGCPSSQ